MRKPLQISTTVFQTAEDGLNHQAFTCAPLIASIRTLNVRPIGA